METNAYQNFVPPPLWGGGQGEGFFQRIYGIGGEHTERRRGLDMERGLKTGLLTFYHIHHYGAPLQAAATKWTVESMGASCDIVHYYVNQNNALFRPPISPQNAASDLHTALHYAALSRRYRRFNAFERDILRVSGKPYKNLDKLRADAPPYDVLISGSDQIWNPLIFPDFRFDPVFFGAFSDARKIAYAPSFGLSRLPVGMDEELRTYLAAFTHLSAREKAGQEILRAAAGLEVPVVLDPVFLRTAQEWEAVAAPPDNLPEGGYLLCYFIHPPAALSAYVRRLSDSLGLPIVQLCGIRRKVHPKARTVLDAGPSEFVRLFRNASFVLTNSFHGTAFSILFEKPFFTAVAPTEREEPEDSRSYNLLRGLGLESRVTGIGGTAPPDAVIDWSSVGEKLSAERDASLTYLRGALYPNAVPVFRTLYRNDAPASGTLSRDMGPASGTLSRNAGLASGTLSANDAPASGTFSPDNGRKRRRAVEPDRSKWPPPRLASHERCTGCAACANVCDRNAITMRRDSEGFPFPAVDTQRCIRCGRCTAVCPILHPMEERPAPAVYAAWVPDSAVRRDSTSGGAFSALAECVLDDGGAVFGAALDGRQRVRHTLCLNKKELWRLRGSKYAQSEIGDTFRLVREALKTRTVLFSGTPCQVDGLYRFLGGRPDNLITCDIVCHGVPSPGVWEAMAQSMRDRSGSDLRAVRFRNKVAGWKDSHFTAVYENGLVDSRPLYETEYGRAFGRALFLRRSCYHCPYANIRRRPGDFTLGDFWGLDAYPQEADRGISLLTVNTRRGSYVFDRLELIVRPATVEQAVKGNPRLVSPTPPQPQRDAFFSAYALEPFENVRKRFLTLPPAPLRILRKAIPSGVENALRALLRRPPR